MPHESSFINRAGRVVTVPPPPPFTDSKGRGLSREEAIERARDYLINHGSIHEIVDRYLLDLFDDEIMEWIVDPDTGEFVDD